jgi:flagellar hook-basal body complex protein FliE
MSAAPIPPIAALPAMGPQSIVQTTLPAVQPSGGASFGQLLINGLDKINDKINNADNMVRAFALDDSIPVHQVTFALDQAQSSMELALQVRARLLDGYQQLMNMQL